MVTRVWYTKNSSNSAIVNCSVCLTETLEECDGNLISKYLQISKKFGELTCSKDIFEIKIFEKISTKVQKAIIWWNYYKNTSAKQHQYKWGYKIIRNEEVLNIKFSFAIILLNYYLNSEWNLTSVLILAFIKLIEII